MTDEELRAIKTRADAAAPGPWRVVSKGAWSQEVWSGTTAYAGGPCAASTRTLANARFIAHARQDVSTLIDEVETLRAVVHKLSQELAEYAEEVTQLKNQSRTASAWASRRNHSR